MTTDVRASAPTPDRVRDAAPKEAADSGGGRCFLCDRPFRPGVAESIDGGEGVDLCVSCGSIYIAGCGC